MGTLSSRLLAYGRRLAPPWHTDIADPHQMARLRSRICAFGGGLSVGLVLLIGLTAPATYLHHQGVTLGAVGLGMLAVAVISAVRGARMGDLEFVAIVTWCQLLTAAGADRSEGGAVAKTALYLTTSSLLGALFVARRRLLVVQTVMTVGILGGVAASSPADQGRIVDLCSGAFILLLVSAVIRLLRELGIRALVQARERELTDPLTGLANRRALEWIGGQHWRSQARLRLSVAVLVIDVDHFKQINDLRGHAAGDEILRSLARLLSSVIRAEDLAVRLGGEEFLVLSAMPFGYAHGLAERIRAAVQRELPPLTVSIGVHEALPDALDVLPASLWSAVEVADRALYRAKGSGRNRVVVSEHGPPYLAAQGRPAGGTSA